MKLQVIIGATREGRVTDRIAKWVVKTAQAMDGVDAELVDLRDYEMPFFDEAISPRFNPDRKPGPAVKRWLDKVAAADAYVLVTPEYNRSTSGVLKNAIDYVGMEMARKPVAVVGHGSSGGAQAVGHLRGIMPGVLAITVPTATYITDRAANILDEAGNLHDEALQRPYGPQTGLQATLDETKWYSDALAAAR